jgi:histidine triad (HIT) family protein
MSCLFCKISEKQIPANVVFEDDETLAFHDIHPAAPVHALVIPKRHITAVRTLANSDLALMGHVMLTAAHVARTLGLEANGFRLVVNDGEDAGQSVHHVHVHVLGGRSMAWPPG